MSENKNFRNGIIATVLIMIAGGLAYSNMKKFTPGPTINNGHGGDEVPPDRQADFRMMAMAARITPEQQKKIEELREKGDWREMRTKMGDILTSDQRQAMRQQFNSRRAERDKKMKAAMGETDFKRFQEKQAERRGLGGPRGPRGGNRPGGGTNSKESRV